MLLLLFQGAPPGALTPGVASLVSAGPDEITLTATAATGGTAPYTMRWQRNEDGGVFANLTDGGGVSGATTLDLVDGSAVVDVEYGYRVRYTDSAGVPAVVFSNEVLAEFDPEAGGDVFDPFASPIFCSPIFCSPIFRGGF